MESPDANRGRADLGRQGLARQDLDRLIDRLDQRIPDGALSLLAGKSAIIAWKGERGAHSPAVDGVVALHRRPGDHARLSYLGRIPFEPEAIRAAALEVPGVPLPAILRYPPRPDRKGGGPMRRIVFRKMLDGSDIPSLLLMDRIGFVASAREEWLDSTSAGGERVHAFAAAHPWLVPTAAGLDPDPIRTAPGPFDPDAAAAAILETVLGRPHPGIPFLVDRMRGFILSEDAGGAIERDRLAALLSLPRDLLPASPGPDLDRLGEAQQRMLACYGLCRDVAFLAGLTGRPGRSFLAKGGDWAATALAIGDRGRGEYDQDDYAEDWGYHYPATAMDGIRDMARSFADEVLAPALLSTGGAWDGAPATDGDPEASPYEAFREPLLGAALGLLVGDRTLPALAEAGADWHVRANGIAVLINGLRIGAGVAGPVPVDDFDIGPRLYVTCLATPQALQDEGAPGPDASGVPGLDHCVASYSGRVLRGETTILSVRRRTRTGYERVSTAEVVFASQGEPIPPRILQHRGRRNAEPPPVVGEALQLWLADHAEEAYSRLARHAQTPGPDLRTSTLVHSAGAWERLRDAWAFALPRPLRGVGPEALLSAAFGTVCGPSMAGTASTGGGRA